MILVEQSCPLFNKRNLAQSNSFNYGDTSSERGYKFKLQSSIHPPPLGTPSAYRRQAEGDRNSSYKVYSHPTV